MTPSAESSLNPELNPDRLRKLSSAAGKTWAAWAILAVFVICGVVHYWDADADDLSSSYVGCRLMATGNADHLYSYDAHDFAAVGPDSAWQAAADSGGYDAFLHPYVQTPLWAYALRPLCGGKFARFEHLFDVLAMLSFAACFLLVARTWAPAFWSPYTLAVAVICLWFSEPFRYAMALMQTHVLFLLLTLASLVLAQRDKPVWAGLLLACAAAVKITPGFLVLYWILTGRWKAVGSMVLWSLGLIVLAVFATGHEVAIYLQDLHRISRVLLVSFNNQSLAAWWMGRFYPDQVEHFQMLPLPSALRIGSTLLMVGLTVAGGWIDRRTLAERASVIEGERGQPSAKQAPLGFMIALIAGTVCAPIAWTHYAIVLIAPVMVLWQHVRGGRRLWLAVAIVLICALNLRPLAMNVVDDEKGRFTVLRSQFYAEVLCLATLSVLAWPATRSRESFKGSAGERFRAERP